MVMLAPCPGAAAGGGVGEMKKAAAEVVGVGLTSSSSIHRRHHRSQKKFPRTAEWEEREGVRGGGGGIRVLHHASEPWGGGDGVIGLTFRRA